MTFTLKIEYVESPKDNRNYSGLKMEDLENKLDKATTDYLKSFAPSTLGGSLRTFSNDAQKSVYINWSAL